VLVSGVKESDNFMESRVLDHNHVLGLR
jgi:hypothetical protein